MKKKIAILIISLIAAVFGYFSEVEYSSDVGINSGEVLKVHFIDVGQGDSTFVELPENKTMLIDAGNPKDGKNISDYIMSLGYNTIDYVIATHPHSDHIGGMAKVIYDFDIKYIYMPRVSHTTNEFKELLKTIENKNLTVKTAKAGVSIYSDDRISIEILSPKREKYEELNNYSAVIKLTYLNNSFLFMGDSEKFVESDLYYDDIDCDVLKVGHHGSSTSSSKTFIKKTSPKYSVISCGKDNDYGHPHIEVISNLLESRILRTDVMGTVILESDGNKIKLVN